MRTPTATAARISASRQSASTAHTAALGEDSEQGRLLLLLGRRRPLRLRVRDRGREEASSGGELQQQCRVRRSRVNIVEPDNFVFVRVVCLLRNLERKRRGSSKKVPLIRPRESAAGRPHAEGPNAPVSRSCLCVSVSERMRLRKAEGEVRK